MVSNQTLGGTELKYTVKAQSVLIKAQLNSITNGKDEIGVDDLIAGMINSNDISTQKALVKIGWATEFSENVFLPVEGLFDKDTETEAGSFVKETTELVEVDNINQEQYRPRYTHNAKRALNRAEIEAEIVHSESITNFHILLGIISSTAVKEIVSHKADLKIRSIILEAFHTEIKAYI